MAPSRPLASDHTRPLKSILKKTSNSGSQNSTAKTDSLFPSSKKDKRRIKHNQLLNKVTKSAERKPRRRRPSKKLVTTLDALADALPDDTETNIPSSSTKAVAGDRPQDQVNMIKRKSMKSRPGAMKRRENIDKGERERFVKNMAQLAGSNSTSGAVGNESLKTSGTSSLQATVPSTSERWAALRGFISQTLETKPELKDLKT
ncbi:hypothetical protein H2200_010393 [Cladophialophora chaetospira]|uniref:Ribosome biogenesis protein SLX9 n=1 Tax=Cladophialophora chaetospira TaxID=386627 RepID=A0AA38X1E1_9EURO|nr:hypothetical protein H2200_010393 [Cladophialophora chaetospira]